MLLSAPEVTMRASGQRRKRLMGSVAWQRERVSDGLRQRVNVMRNQEQELPKKAKKATLLTVYFLKMGECREVLGGGPAPPSKL